MPRQSRADLGLAGSAVVLRMIGGFVVLAGGALGVVRFVGGTPAERGLEGVTGAFALAMVVGVPGWLVLLAIADRPAMLLPAAIVLVPLSFLSFAGVTLPLLVPAVVLFVAYRRRWSLQPPRAVRPELTAAAVLALMVAAVIALFLHADPRSYTTPTGGGSTSDVITVPESLASLALSAAAIGAGWSLAGSSGTTTD